MGQIRTDRTDSRGQVKTDRFVNRLFISIIGSTPDVSLGNAFKTANSGVTTITNFLNGVDTQQVDVLCGDGNTTIQNNANIALTGGTNFTCVINVGISFRYDASQTKWVQFGGTGSGGGGSGCIPGAPTNSLQKNSGAGTCVASSIVDNGTNVTISEPVIASNGGTINGTFAGSPVFSLTGNEAIKPASTEPVRYVTATGNDSNDGRSWGSAKLTVYAALQALPGGSTGIVGGGTIKLSGTVAYGGPAANQGMWIMGGGDPNFGSPPSGWLKKITSDPVNIECDFPNLWAANSHTPNCLMTGGGTTDLVHPAIWLSATTGVVTKNVLLNNYLNTFVKIGIDSNNNRNGTGGTSGVTLDGISWNHGACRFGGGPGIDIGTNTFWVWLRNFLGTGCAFGELAIAAPGTPGLSRASNIVTVITTTPNSIVAGEFVTTQFTTDASFIGSFAVASVIDSTHFTFNQNGPNATSGNGQVITGAKAAVNIDPGAGGGSGLIFVEDFGINSGIIRLHPGGSGGGVYIRNGTYEGDFTSPDAPPVLVTRGVQTSAGTGTNLTVEHLEVADSSSITPIPGVRIDNSSGPYAVVSRVDAGVQGPAILLGGTPIYGGSDTSLKSLQAGFSYAGRITGGGIDVDRRAFSPRAVSFANLATTTPASWTLSGTGTITTGISAPDGTTNAGRLTATSGAVAFSFYTANNVTLTLGDTYIWGLWQRSANVPGIALQGPGTFILNANGFGANDQCSTWNGGTGTSTSLTLYRQVRGDGQWIWHSGLCKVTSNPVNAGLNLNLVLFSPQIVDAFGPVVIKVPSGTASDNELFELAANLASFPETAAVGDIAILKGHSLNLTGGTLTLASEVLTTSPRGPFNVLLPGALTATWTGETWTLDKAITVTRVQAQLKTAPSGCSTSAIARLTDGSTPINLTLSAAANDSGTISQSYAAGSVMTVAVQTAAAGCTTSPGDANVVVQYRTN